MTQVFSIKTLAKRLFGEREFWNTYLPFYDYMSKHPKYEKMLCDTYNALEIEKSTSGNFLDAGCGSGNFIIYALNLNRNIKFYGFDLSEKGLELVRKKAEKNNCIDRVDVIKYYFKEKLPYHDNMFDGISAINFIMYLDDQTLENFIRESRRILKNSGKIALVYPNGEIKLDKDLISKMHNELIENLKTTREKFKYSIIFTFILFLNIPMKIGLNTYPHTREKVENLLKKYGFSNINSKSTYYSDSVILTSGTIFK
ncbi:MAG: class I SAM-dependent methyltransferase [Archaeoglobaceae archaeon]